MRLSLNFTSNDLIIAGRWRRVTPDWRPGLAPGRADGHPETAFLLGAERLLLSYRASPERLSTLPKFFQKSVVQPVGFYSSGRKARTPPIQRNVSRSEALSTMIHAPDRPMRPYGCEIGYPLAATARGCKWAPASRGSPDDDWWSIRTKRWSDSPSSSRSMRAQRPRLTWRASELFAAIRHSSPASLANGTPLGAAHLVPVARMGPP
jgi:hypothetical protein